MSDGRRLWGRMSRLRDNVISYGIYIVVAVVVVAVILAITPEHSREDLEQQIEEVTNERDELKEEVNRLEERVSMLNDELDDAHGELTDYNDLEVFSMDALQVFAGDIVGRLDAAKDYIADNDLDGAIYSIDIAIEDAEALLEYCDG